MNFSERIVAELERRGWSRSEAARRGNISASMFDKVINGYAEPGIKFLKGIAQAFEIPLAEVISWVESTQNPRSEQIERILNYLDKLPESNLESIEIQLAALASHVKPPKTGKTGPLGGGRQ